MENFYTKIYRTGKKDIGAPATTHMGIDVYVKVDGESKIMVEVVQRRTLSGALKSRVNVYNVHTGKVLHTSMQVVE